MNTDSDPRPTNDGCHADANGTAGGPTGPASQIPGLSHGGPEGPEEKARGGRRVGVLESDSVYVKLAKQGGQKGLLWHEETNLGTKPNVANAANAAYAAPDWFAAGSQNHDEPSPTDSEKGLRDTAPFGSDNKSTWERQADDSKKLGDGASSHMQKLSVSEEDQQDGSKFRKTAHNKKPDSVSMSKLLGFGYAKDEKETSN